MRLYPILSLVLLGSFLPASSYGETPPVPIATVETHTLPQEQILDGVAEAVNRSKVSREQSIYHFVGRRGRRRSQETSWRLTRLIAPPSRKNLCILSAIQV